MTMLIDDREMVHKQASKRLPTYIKSEHTITRLEYGDISILGNGPKGKVAIGIERKRFRDLTDSIISGRLSGHQLIGLQNCYDFTYLLVEGLFKVGKDGYIRRPKGRGWVVCQIGDRPMTYQYLYNYLNTLSIFGQVIVQFTPSIRISGLWVDSIYHWWTKPWKDHKSHMQFYSERPPARAFFRKPKLVVRIVKEIEGVGWDRAKAIGRKYPTIMALMCAEAKELTEIEGIGKKTASNILQALRGA